ncbi:MAG: hypothetical protein AB7O47_08835 [Flavobacteriales bacterium]
MTPIKKIQLKVGRFNLAKEKKRLNRKTVSCNLETAATIGILYNATQKEDCDVVKNLVIDLKQQKKDVLALGYVNLKEMGDIFKPHISYAYFDNRKLNKSFIPRSTDVKNFIEKPFSLLIDLNLNNDFPLEYIASLSNATFKVGATGAYRDDDFDLTINIGENQNTKYLVTQIKHYLALIK